MASDQLHCEQLFELVKVVDTWLNNCYHMAKIYFFLTFV